MDKTTARDYIRANFHEDDRLAIVLIQKSTGRVTQRVAGVERITSDQFQAWLRYMNSQRHEVYVSMNALKPDARGRTKADVAAVRHIYLDFDKDGPAAVAAMRARPDLPTPNHILESSPGKFQVVWRVDGFGIDQAEALMRSLVREHGADPAATDAARVMRVPSFCNHKYRTPHFVTVENLSDTPHGPEHFPTILASGRTGVARAVALPQSLSRRELSQSERDWHFALRALARGENVADITSRIAAHRPDKPNPKYYAQHTVQKAIATMGSRTESICPDR